MRICAADAREELAQVAGLGDVVDAAGLVAAVDLVGRGLGHDEDDGHVDEARVVLQPLAEGEAVHLPHVGRDEEEVGDQGLDDGERAVAAGGGDHLVTLGAQGSGVHSQVQISVVDDDDPGGLGLPRPLQAAGPIGAAGKGTTRAAPWLVSTGAARA